MRTRSSTNISTVAVRREQWKIDAEQFKHQFTWPAYVTRSADILQTNTRGQQAARLRGIRRVDESGHEVGN